jgi:hypothetical protein
MYNYEINDYLHDCLERRFFCRRKFIFRTIFFISEGKCRLLGLLRRVPAHFHEVLINIAPTEITAATDVSVTCSQKYNRTEARNCARYVVWRVSLKTGDGTRLSEYSNALKQQVLYRSKIKPYCTLLKFTYVCRLGNMHVGFTSFSTKSLPICTTHQRRQCNPVQIVTTHFSKFLFNLLIALSSPTTGLLCHEIFRRKWRGF